MCPQERMSNLQRVYSRADSSACHPTYRDRKNKDKKVSASPTPTHVDPSQVSVLGWVDGKKTAKKSETPAGKKKRTDDSPKPSSKKSKSSNKPRSDELRDLDEKWGERFARLEAMLLSKMFPVPLEPVKKPSSVVQGVFSDQPFFDPGTSISGLSSGVTVGGAGPSLAQTTSEAAFVNEAASKSATCLFRVLVLKWQQNASRMPPSLLRLLV